MDALSAALNSVGMTGAIFVDADLHCALGICGPRRARASHSSLAPGTECVGGLSSGQRGERAVFGFQLESDGVPVVDGRHRDHPPRGMPYGHQRRAGGAGRQRRRRYSGWLAGDVSPVRLGGGGGEVTRFVCGYFGCEPEVARLFLAGLPSIVKVNVRGYAQGQWLESSIRHLLERSDIGAAGMHGLCSRRWPRRCS